MYPVVLHLLGLLGPAKKVKRLMSDELESRQTGVVPALKTQEGKLGNLAGRKRWDKFKIIELEDAPSCHLLWFQQIQSLSIPLRASKFGKTYLSTRRFFYGI